MIVVQRRVSPKGVPAPRSLRRWAQLALGRLRAEITLRIVTEAESRTLNRRYRSKNKPTNVLSFPYSPALTPPIAPRSALPSPALRERDSGAAFGRGLVVGDLVICASVVNREAREQNKPRPAPWAHMVVHGVLHLRGLDHIKSSDARVMEAKERAILATLSYPDPYLLR